MANILKTRKLVFTQTTEIRKVQQKEVKSKILISKFSLVPNFIPLDVRVVKITRKRWGT